MTKDFQKINLKNDQYRYDDKTINQSRTAYKKFKDVIQENEYVNNLVLEAYIYCSQILQYQYLYYKYKKRITEGIEVLNDGIKLLDDGIVKMNDAVENIFKDSESIKMTIASVKENLSILYYDLGMLYWLKKDEDKMIDNFERAIDLNHIGAMNNLAYFYADESSPYYNLEASKDLYLRGSNLKIDEKYITKNMLVQRKLIQFLMCIRTAHIMHQETDYAEAIQYCNHALELENTYHFSKDIVPKIERLKDSAMYRLNEQIVKTSKRETIENMFSDKAKKHMTEENYVLIETSLLIYEYLNSLHNDSLDYSSATISALKCLESILFQVIGLEYYDYIAKLNHVDYSLVPKDFKKKQRDKYLNKLCSRKSLRMELGSFIYACSTRDMDTGKYVVNELFNEFMIDRGIKDFADHIDDFIKKLVEIKDFYRNPTAHKERVDKTTAQDCLDCLLNTIRYINMCLDLLYKN